MSAPDPLATTAEAIARAEQILRRQGHTGDQGFEHWLAAWQAHQRGLAVPPALKGCLAAIDDRADVDVVGLAYQHFLPYRFKARFGQFFTPRPVARLMVAHAAIQPDEHVVDPFSGSGGLLLLAAERGARVSGVEIDAELARFAARNLHGSAVRCADAFGEDLDADVIVANPPFSLRITEPAVLRALGLNGAVSAERAFAAALHRWVRPHGRAAIVWPHSVLTAPQHEATRHAVREHFEVTRVCELPEGTFRPFGGAQGRAVVLWLARHHTGPVHWARVNDPGYDTGRRALVGTGGTEIDALVRGEGWRVLPPGQWRPKAPPATAGRVCDHAAPVRERAYPSRQPAHDAAALDLGDVDRTSGQAHPRSISDTRTLRGVRHPVRPGEVLVARLRPERGVVTVVPQTSGPVYGSPEWVVLRSPRPHALFHLVRTPAWRSGLPEPSGQTRPRLRAADVLDAPVRWPPPATLERLDHLSRALHHERERITAALADVQRAVDAFADGTLDADDLHELLDEADPSRAR